MAAHDHETRVLAAQAAALTRWGKAGSAEDRREALAPARKGLQARFEREADPDGKLSPADRARAADRLLRAHMLRLSIKAKAARRKAREAAREAETTEAALAEIGGEAA